MTRITVSALFVASLFDLLGCAGSAEPADTPASPGPAAKAPTDEYPVAPEPTGEPESWTPERLAKCPVTYKDHCFPSAEEACAFINCPEERCEFLYSYPNEIYCRAPEDDVPPAPQR